MSSSEITARQRYDDLTAPLRSYVEKFGTALKGVFVLVFITMDVGIIGLGWLLVSASRLRWATGPNVDILLAGTKFFALILGVFAAISNYLIASIVVFEARNFIGESSEGNDSDQHPVCRFMSLSAASVGAALGMMGSVIGAVTGFVLAVVFRAFPLRRSRGADHKLISTVTDVAIILVPSVYVSFVAPVEALSELAMLPEFSTLTSERFLSSKADPNPPVSGPTLWQSIAGFPAFLIIWYGIHTALSTVEHSRRAGGNQRIAWAIVHMGKVFLLVIPFACCVTNIVALLISGIVCGLVATLCTKFVTMDRFSRCSVRALVIGELGSAVVGFALAGIAVVASAFPLTLPRLVLVTFVGVLGAIPALGFTMCVEARGMFLRGHRGMLRDDRRLFGGVLDRVFDHTSIPDYWRNLAASVSRRSEVPADAATLVAAEHLIARFVRIRQLRPTGRLPDDWLDANAHWRKRSERASDSCLGVLWDAEQEARSQSTNRHRLEALSEKLAVHSDLRPAVYLILPELFRFEVGHDPNISQTVVAEMVSREERLELKFFWTMLSIRAHGLYGDLDRFFTAIDNLTTKLAGAEFSDDIEAGGFGDVFIPPDHKVESIRADGPIFRSSRFRLRMLVEMYREVVSLYQLAVLGGDRAAITTIDRQRKRLWKQISKFIPESGRDLEEFSRRIELETELLSLLRRVNSNPSIETAYTALARVVERWSSEGFGPLLARPVADTLPLVSFLVAQEWSDRMPVLAGIWDDELVEADSDRVWRQWSELQDLECIDNEELLEDIELIASFVASDLGPSGDLYQFIIEQSDDHWPTRVSGRAIAKAADLGANRLAKVARSRTTENAIALPWLDNPSYTALLWMVAYRACLALGRYDEAIALAAQCRSFCQEANLDAYAYLSDLVVCDLAGMSLPLPPSQSSVEHRRLRVAYFESKLEIAQSPEDVLGVLGEHDGIKFSRDAVGAIGADDVLVIQYALPAKLITLVARQGASLECDVYPIPRPQLLDQIFNLRHYLDWGDLRGRIESSASELSEVLSPIPNVKGTIYYVGLGPLAHLPLNTIPYENGYFGKLLSWVRLHQVQISDSDGLGRHKTGQALWWSPPDAPLVEAQRECTELPGFNARKATNDSLCEALRRPVPVHIACHGESASLDDLDTTLWVEDSKISSSVLAEFPIRAPIVYLSACETSLGSLLPGENHTGLTGALLAGGASHVIGSLWKISDARACAMSHAFWDLVRAGVPYPEALRQIRAREVHPSDWGAMELHARGIPDR